MSAYRQKVTKYITFLIVPDGKNEPINFKIRQSFVQLVFGLMIVLVILVALGAASYWKVAEIALDYSRVKEENFELLKSVDQIDKLKEDLALVKQFESQIRGSLNGYVSIEESANADSVQIEELDFEKMSIRQRGTIFNHVPSQLPVEGFMARGYETQPFFSDPHLGVDIAAPTGTPVKAAAEGVVLFAGWTSDGGYALIIEHKFGFSTIYKHNERNLVGEMEKVSKGQVIALLGNTGKITSGPHLHFEVWRNGLPVDPLYYIEVNKNTKS